MNLNFIFDDDFYHTLNSNHILKKYYILFNTFDYIIKHHSKYYSFLYNKRLGRKIKYPRSAFIKAFIYKHLENIKHTSQLINILRANPKLAIICGFKYNIPDDSLFYRFLKSTPSYIIDDIFNSIVQLLKQHNIISTDIVAIDSKPILAYTKHNNFKNPYRALNKDKPPFTSNRNCQATIGFYSAGASSKKIIKKIYSSGDIVYTVSLLLMEFLLLMMLFKIIYKIIPCLLIMPPVITICKAPPRALMQELLPLIISITMLFNIFCRNH